MYRRNLIINLTGTFLSCHKASKEIQDIIYKNTNIYSKNLVLTNKNLKHKLETNLLVNLNDNKYIITYSGIATKEYLHTFHSDIRWYSGELYHPFCLQVINNSFGEIIEIPTSYQKYNNQVNMVYLLNENIEKKENKILHLLER